MFGNLADSSVEAMTIATTEAQRFSQFYLGTEHLFIGLCKVSDEELWQGFQEAGFDAIYWRRKVRAAISVSGSSLSGDQMVFTPRFEKVMKISERIARKQNSDQLTPRHLFLGLLAEGGGIPVRLMRSNGIDIEKLALSLTGMKTSSVPNPNARKFPFLCSIGRDLTQEAMAGKLAPTVGRHQEMLFIAQSLNQLNRGSVLIVGEAGTGKSSLVYGFAQMTVSEDVNEALKGLQIFEVSMSSLLAGTKYRGDFEERMKTLVREASSDRKVVLFIDEFHLVMGAGSAGDAMDAANLLKPALAAGSIKCIGATTTTEYRRHIERDDALARRFAVLKIAEPTPDEALVIVTGLKERFETYHNVTISDEALEAVVRLTEKYIQDRHFPDKALDLLDKTCSTAVLGSIHARATRVEKPVVDRSAIISTLEQIVGYEIPEARWGKDTQNLAQNLGDKLREFVIGQDEAVHLVSRKIQIHCAGLASPERPIGSFLFVGPTGVGKTELARALAINWFGTERKLLRFDMSEYAEPHTVSRLLGSPPGYVGSEEEGQLSRAVRSNPYAVVLFDEIEKAHPEVMKIFLQILEPGIMTDNHGRSVSFRDTIVIFTSNIGSGLFAEAKRMGIRNEGAAQNVETRVLAEVRRELSPELRNRLDNIILFHPLEDQTVLHRIVDKQLREIRLLLRERGLEMVFEPEALDAILAEGYDIQYGARHLKRTVDRVVREPLALSLQTGQFQRGDVVRVAVKDGSLEFEKT